MLFRSAKVKDEQEAKGEAEKAEPIEKEEKQTAPNDSTDKTNEN